jgi:hypothetical protein
VSGGMDFIMGIYVRYVCCFDFSYSYSGGGGGS